MIAVNAGSPGQLAGPNARIARGARCRSKALEPNKVRPFFAYQDLARRSQMAVLDLVPEKRDLAERENRRLHGFENREKCRGHSNASGHRAAGDLIADHVCQNLLERRDP